MRCESEKYVQKGKIQIEKREEERNEQIDSSKNFVMMIISTSNGDKIIYNHRQETILIVKKFKNFFR